MAGAKIGAKTVARDEKIILGAPNLHVFHEIFMGNRSNY